MAAWMDMLPEDVRATLEVGDGGSEGSGELTAALAAARAPEVPEVVRRYASDARAFGRPRRIRLVAWVANAEEAGPGVRSAEVIRRLTGEDEDGEAGGSDAVGILFLEDIHALAVALSRRFGRQAMEPGTIAAIEQSAFEVESDLEFSRGGI